MEYATLDFTSSERLDGQDAEFASVVVFSADVLTGYSDRNPIDRVERRRLMFLSFPPYPSQRGPIEPERLECRG
jgi:hypothetical protein